MSQQTENPARRPECNNCDYFRKNAPNDQRCAKHRFVMPRIDWQILCRDWQTQGQSPHFNRMAADTLYYYSTGSGDVIMAPFEHFSRLQRLLVSVSLREDQEFGWSIFPRHYRHYFPAPDTLLTFHIGGRKCKFQAITAERKLVAEMIPVGDGRWERQYHMQDVYMLASLESPRLLLDWLDMFMDMETFAAEHFAPTLFAFVEIISQKEYVLHADFLAYGKYAR